jgi:hypothetical protein
VTVSVVLRIADAALAAGRLAGEAELVATGERTVVRDAGELIAFLSGSADAGRRVPPVGDRTTEQGGE